MEYRSTAAGQHISGHFVAGVGSSHGIEIGGGSTGGTVQPVGDDSNITLTVKGKGVGHTVIGSTASKVTLGGSTGGVSLMQASLIQFTVPALSSAGAAGSVADSTATLTGATTNAFYIVQQRVAYNSTVDPGVYVTARCSTADELRLTFWNHSGSSLSGSTSSAYLLRVAF